MAGLEIVFRRHGVAERSRLWEDDMGLCVSDISRLGPAAQRQVLDKLREKAVEAKDPAKYRNVKAVRTMPNGEERVFDSQKEARRYDELMVLLRAGQIRELKLQVQYTLQDSYVSAEGNRVRAIRYVADFSYQRLVGPSSGPAGHLPPGEGWETVVEDVKSKATETRVYKIKKKLMQEKFGICVREV